MTYQDYVIKQIEKTNAGVPIYTANLANCLANEYNLDTKKANAAVSVAMKRIITGNRLENLRFFQKGIYYLTTKTPFGEVGISKELLIQNKYLIPDIGYETGYNLLHKMGLTTQIPTKRIIATNKAKDSIREDKTLGIYVKPPKTEITAKNKIYLQTLDAMELIDKAPIDEEEPYLHLAKYIQNEKIQFEQLLAFADMYYGINTVTKVAHIAVAGGRLL